MHFTSVFIAIMAYLLTITTGLSIPAGSNATASCGGLIEAYINRSPAAPANLFSSNDTATNTTVAQMGLAANKGDFNKQDRIPIWELPECHRKCIDKLAHKASKYLPFFLLLLSHSQPYLTLLHSLHTTVLLGQGHFDPSMDGRSPRLLRRSQVQALPTRLHNGVDCVVQEVLQPINCRG
ncbi:hypothetical protein GGS20DRAFT_560138 [Poronia punctata]|nr:hypothetical protein GGS20DRAFT_560138 [Poronia punctata]